MTRRKTQLEPAIHRIPLGRLRIFEITEAELEALERGSPESLFLNLAIAVLSIATSFLITLTTTKIDNDRTFSTFVIVTSVGFVSGLTFGLLWFRLRRSVTSVAAIIRDRIPPEGVQEQASNILTE